MTEKVINTWGPDDNKLLVGYAVSFTDWNGWSYRTVEPDTPMEDGETFYSTYAEIPQEARDWFESN